MNKEQIYDILNGYYEPENAFLCGKLAVEDEFEGEKECALLYSKVYQARMHLAEKLGKDEDVDVEEIVNGMSEIGRILALKMYEYGRLERTL